MAGRWRGGGGSPFQHRDTFISFQVYSNEISAFQIFLHFSFYGKKVAKINPNSLPNKLHFLI